MPSPPSRRSSIGPMPLPWAGVRRGHRSSSARREGCDCPRLGRALADVACRRLLSAVAPESKPFVRVCGAKWHREVCRCVAVRR